MVVVKRYMLKYVNVQRVRGLEQGISEGNERIRTGVGSLGHF